MRKARVVFDLRTNHETGVFRYGRSLFAAAVGPARERGIELFALTHPGDGEVLARTVLEQSGIQIDVTECPHREGFVRNSRWTRQWIEDRSTDLYYTPHYTVDLHCPVPYVFTVHDVTRLRSPERSYNAATFAKRWGADDLQALRNDLRWLEQDGAATSETNDLFHRYFSALNRYLVSRARAVVTVSEASASEIRSTLSIPRDRLYRVPGAVDPAVFHRQAADEVEAVERKFGIRRPYLLYVGLTHPHKRFEWLVRQFVEEIRPNTSSGAQLVVVGGYADGTSRLIEPDALVFAGRVSDRELAALYSGAAALVSGSRSEGYNLPAVEALACGTQVIAADLPVAREVLGSGAHLYPAHDRAALAGLCIAVLQGALPIRKAPSVTTWQHSTTSLLDVIGTALTRGDMGSPGA